MNIRKHRAAVLLAGATLFGTAGCDALKGSGLVVSIDGKITVDGDTPADFDFKLYTQTDNSGAFDTSYCLEDSGDNICFGRVDVAKLNTPVDGIQPTVDGTNFSLGSVPVDVLYVLVVTGDDDEIVCTTDVIGFNEETKVVDQSNAITMDADSDIDTFDLPRNVRLSCSAPASEPEAPADPEPVETGETDDDGDIPDPATPEWTSFTITDKGGSPTYADASAGSVTADIDCGSDFPSVLEVKGTAENTSATAAYVRIQFGSDDDATFRTIEVPIVDGQVDQAISLTGGYSVVQLDLDENLDGAGESYTVAFCDREDPPAQEMLVILSWDADDTDVDTHVLSDGEEVAYYSLSQSWGDLDIDDVNGFGPETFTSAPGETGRTYEVKVHYYSDHGNGDTTATARVVYWDDSTGETCDITATQTMSSYDWWTVGAFGPGMACDQ